MFVAKPASNQTAGDFLSDVGPIKNRGMPSLMCSWYLSKSYQSTMMGSRLSQQSNNQLTSGCGKSPAMVTHCIGDAMEMLSQAKKTDRACGKFLLPECRGN